MEAHFLFLVWHFVQKSPYYSPQHLLKYSNCIHIMRKKMAVWITQWTSVTGFCMTLTSLSSWVTWITRSGGHFLGCSVCVCAKLLHVCLTLCDPMDCGWPGSSVQGILQERMLEWVAMSSSRVSSQLWDHTRVCYISSIDRWVLCHRAILEGCCVMFCKSSQWW